MMMMTMMMILIKVITIKMRKTTITAARKALPAFKYEVPS